MVFLIVVKRVVVFVAWVVGLHVMMMYYVYRDGVDGGVERREQIEKNY